MTTVTIEVIHDFVCAWCFIGKRNLDRAVALHRKVHPDGRSDTITITWRPYYLNYNPRGHSVDKTDLVHERFGSTMTAEQRTVLFGKMDRAGRSVGIYFKGGGKIGGDPGTRDAHRLVHLLALEGSGCTDLVVEKIYEAYHEREMDISDRNVLKELAVEAGVDGDLVEEWLESNTGTDEVDKQARQNKDELKSGVPVYIVQGVQIDGSADPGEFLEALSKAKGESME